MNEVKLGQLVEGDAHRDAVHVAVAPCVAGEWLEPGDRVFLGVANGRAYLLTTAYPHTGVGVGIVDPFLSAGIKEGERFWLCLYPGTVTSLRHVWTHPAFQLRPKAVGDG